LAAGLCRDLLACEGLSQQAASQARDVLVQALLQQRQYEQAALVLASVNEEPKQ
jgi:Tfp pilus assembly protein PilF